jgi:EmrB/QacA subfamily drug resistance transporter
MLDVRPAGRAEPTASPNGHLAPDGAAPAVPGAAIARPGERPVNRWLIGGIVATGSLSSLLAATVVNVAVADLEKVFATSLNNVEWVVTGYLLGLSVTIPLAGWATDRFGAKRVYLLTIIIFTVTSALCGAAWSIQSEIFFRVLQGMSGGMIMPVGMAILMRMTPAEQRGRMMAILGVPMMLGPAIGPTVGGWLINVFDWRAIFWVNIPLGVAAVVACWIWMTESRTHNPGRFDVVGFLTATPGVALIIYALTQAAENGWGSLWALVPLAAGVLLAIFFVVWELLQEHPLLDMYVFEDGGFRAAMIVSVVVAAALFGPTFLIPVFMQQAQGYDTLGAGLLVGAQGLGAAAVMPVSGYLTDRLGAKPVVFFGILVLTLTTALLTMVGVGTSGTQWATLLLVRGIGIGFTMMPAFSAAYVSLSHAAIGRATAISNTVQRIFSSLGIAVLATVIQARAAYHQPVLHQRPTPAQLHAAATSAFAAAFDDTLWVAAAIVILGLPAALLLKRPTAAGEAQRATSRPLFVAVLVFSLLTAVVLLARGFGISPPPL